MTALLCSGVPGSLHSGHLFIYEGGSLGLNDNPCCKVFFYICFKRNILETSNANYMHSTSTPPHQYCGFLQFPQIHREHLYFNFHENNQNDQTVVSELKKTE